VSASPSNDARFQALFAAHQARIQSFCLRRLTAEDAHEATAETFVTAWRRIDDVPKGDEGAAWLFGVARNVVRNMQRGGRRRIRLAARVGSFGGVAPEEPEPQVIRNAEHAGVDAALRRLRPDDSEILRLKAWDGLTHEAIGKVLGISARAAEGRYARALNKLARELKSKTYGNTMGSPLSSERSEAS